MQLFPSTVPSDPTLLASIFPGAGSPATAPGVAAAPCASATLAFSELFPELGTAPVIAPELEIPAGLAALDCPVAPVAPELTVPRPLWRGSDSARFSSGAATDTIVEADLEIELSETLGIEPPAPRVPGARLAAKSREPLPRASLIEVRAPDDRATEVALPLVIAPESVASLAPFMPLMPPPSAPAQYLDAPEPQPECRGVATESEEMGGEKLPAEPQPERERGRPLPRPAHAPLEFGRTRIVSTPAVASDPASSGELESPPPIACDVPSATATPARPEMSRKTFFSTRPDRAHPLPLSAAPPAGDRPLAPVRDAAAALPYTFQLAKPDATPALAVQPAVAPANVPAPVAADRAARRAVPCEANFAADGEPLDARAETAGESEVNSFLNTGHERLETSDTELGIDVAKSGAAMKDRFATPPPHPAFEYVARTAESVRIVSLEELPFETAPAVAAAPLRETAAPEQASTAHRAVEVALRAVDDLSSRERKAVNLDFSVGDADLQVRVELHRDEVRTTFRTDSPELRAALAQEWQAVASAPAGERTLRLAPASFAAADAAGLDASTGDAASRDRQSASRRGDGAHAAADLGRARERSAADVAPVRRALTSVSTSRHLHILA